MKRLILTAFAMISMFFGVESAPVSPETAKPQPLTLPLQCAGGDCPLLKGAPQTAGMRSGLVRLKSGETVGWHTTGKNEESLVILAGRGEALIEGQSARTFSAPAFAYIPPDTRHNVANTGKEILEYVYVVAPTQPQP
jgi:mannose-6-phosphate isomerase-like protein (cupin superfamily)